MTYKKFIEDYLAKGLIKRQRADLKSAEKLILLDRMRRKRNIFTYEIDISISKTEADNAFDTAVKFVNMIKGIIKKENPQADFGF
ncbi:MAG: hypothetical protein HZC45_00405 [Deltaproteobacteria bacterium]|nr:hypothetical protein [Deltaproteobacteria bacterium]